MLCLITGVKGFLGKHFEAKLLSLGFDVVGLDIKDEPWANCRDLFTGTDAISIEHYDLVIHAAAIIGGRTKIEGEPLTTAENIELDSMYFRWLARVKPEHAVYFSSSAVYPVYLQSTAYQGHKLRENDINFFNSQVGQPDEVYGWSKLIGEVLARKAIKAGVPVTIVRPFSGYGSDQDLDYPFPIYIQRGLQHEDPFTVWGNGTQIRDFIHVDDIVNATLALIEHDAEIWKTNNGNPGDLLEPINLCTGRDTSFNHLAWLICDIIGYKADIKHMKTAPVGVMHRVGDPARMNKIYRPQITLEEGIQRALNEFPRRMDQNTVCPRCRQIYGNLDVDCRPESEVSVNNSDRVTKVRPYCGKVGHYI
jgi:nucleoside-diphosphate-sugar epimerase